MTEPLRARLMRWLRLRPAEWVLLGYCVFLVMVPRSNQAPVRAIPQLGLILGAFELYLVRLAVVWFKTPWKTPGSRLSTLFPATVLFAVIPAGYGLFDSLAHVPDFLPLNRSDGGLGSAVLDPVLFVLNHTMIGCLPLLFWLALGCHIKTHDALAARDFLVNGGARAVDFARNAAAILAIIFAYSSMSEMTTHPWLPDQDALMEQLDRALFFGASPTHIAQHFVTPWLSEWLAFCYVMYVSLVPLTWGGLLWSARPKVVAEFAFVVTATLATGYVCYTLVPVRGPMYTQTFAVSVTEYLFDWTRQALLEPFRIARDCFPSLHTALSMGMLLIAWRHVRWLAWVMAPIVLSIPFACVYFRYHYVVDVLAGLALAAVVSQLAKRLFPEPG